MKIILFFSCFITFASTTLVSAQTPGGVSGATSWFKADAGTSTTANGAAVSSWSSAVTNPNLTALTATGTAQPTYQSIVWNFNPGISFNGTSNVLQGTISSSLLNVLGAQNNNIFGVLGIGATGVNVYFQVSDGSSSRIQNRLSLENTSVQFPTNTNVISATGLVQNNATIPSLFNASTTNVASPGINCFYSINGGTAVTGSYTGSLGAGSTTAAQRAYFIGGYNNTTSNQFFTQGNFCEFITFPSTLTATQKSQVLSYLALKYGITLGSTSSPVNYVGSGGTVSWTGDATYQNNIAGIVRDDNSALNQKQSQSVNTNSNGQVTIGLGTIAASNVLNTNTFNNNSTALIWGDNGNTQSMATASTALASVGTGSVRMNRIWKCVNTNNLSQVLSLQIPQTMIGTVSSPSSCATYALVTASDAAFTTNVQTSALSTSGSNYVCNFLPPTGTFYFTFAKLGAVAQGQAYLPTIATNTAAQPACAITNGYTYYYLTGDQTKKLFAINWTGSSENGTTIGTVSYNTNPSNGAPYSKTYGSVTCNIMGRLIQITPPSGAVISASGVKVRIYYDSTELKKALNMTPAASNTGWFKHPGDATSTVNDNSGATLFNATYFTPTFGSEDGVYYAEFSGITSFSTFGYVASNKTGSTLPVTLDNFTAKAVNCEAIVNWTGTVENNFSYYEVQQSTDGNNFTTTEKIAGKGSGTNYEAQFTLSDNNEYVRLKMNDNNGTVTYSNILPISSNCVGNSTVVAYPNPVTHQLTISGLGSGNKTIQVIAVNGIAIYKSNTANQQLSVNTQNWPRGIYLVSVHADNGTINTIKIIKQ